MPKSRVLIFAASSFWMVLLLVVLVFRGGGAVPVERQSTTSSLGLAAQAAALAEVGDYEGAWRFYHRTLETAPEDVSLWYALGVTLSHLNRRAETAEAFHYVVSHGHPDSEEVKRARRWLVTVGILAEPVTFSTTDEQVALRGKATWGEPERNRPVPKVHILLEGLDGAAQGKRFATRVPLGEVYQFERLPAGRYRLIGGAADHRLWDLTLSVEDGQETTLDLGKHNSSNSTATLYL